MSKSLLTYLNYSSLFVFTRKSQDSAQMRTKLTHRRRNILFISAFRLRRRPKIYPYRTLRLMMIQVWFCGSYRTGLPTQRGGGRVCSRAENDPVINDKLQLFASAGAVLCRRSDRVRRIEDGIPIPTPLYSRADAYINMYSVYII